MSYSHINGDWQPPAKSGQKLCSCAASVWLVKQDPEYRWQGLMKIFKNLALMYRQNFKNFLKIIPTAAGGPQKSKFVWTDHQASKKPQFSFSDGAIQP
jgi:hypothetical protein